jgi:hypothetical protein
VIARKKCDRQFDKNTFGGIDLVGLPGGLKTEAIMGILIRPEDDIAEPPPAPEIADSAVAPMKPGIRRASPVGGDVAGAAPELSPIAPPTALEIAPAAAAPSVGDPDIDLIPPRIRPVEANIALKNMQGRWLLEPAPAPQPPWIGKLSFVFSLTAVVGLGAAALGLPNGVRNPAGGIAASEPPLNLYSPEPPTQRARLVVQSQHGLVNEALPLGISLAEASGGESLTLLGLVAGTRLSAGTPVGATVWRLSARELGNALAYAPNDFVGVMEAVIDLRSASGQPMDVQVVRLEWIRKEEERFTPQLDSSKPLSASQPLELAEIALKRAEDSQETADRPPLLVQASRITSGKPAFLGLTLHGRADDAVVMITGLVPGMTLSTGSKVGVETWEVPATALPNAWIVPPANFVGVVDFVAELHLADRTMVDRRRIRLEWQAPIPAPTAVSPTVTTDRTAVAPVSEHVVPSGQRDADEQTVERDRTAVAPPREPNVAPSPVAEIVVLLKRGQELMRNGDLAAARLVLRHAAEAKSAEAALTLGATYDPVILRELRVYGFPADVGMARTWYEKAKELGSPEAARRLDILAR